MNGKFTRTIESFTCTNCGTFVDGNGYTNHCPECLWSRHVDVNPGDRACDCKGMMKPVAFDVSTKDKVVIHKCERCGTIRRNKLGEKDNFEVMLEIISAGSYYTEDD